MTNAEPSSSALGALSIQSRRQKFALSGLLIALVIVATASVAIGAVSIPPGSILAAVGRAFDIRMPWSVTDQQAVVLTMIRLPRVVLGLCVGAGLAVSGALLQGLFRNPLADPGLVGVSSGAAFGAALAIVTGASLGAALPLPARPFVVTAGAFVAGLATTLLVYQLATRHGRTSVSTMLLAGIAVNAIGGAGVGALVLFADDNQLRDITFWTLGGLGGATWTSIAAVAPLVLGVILAVPRLASSLNAMLLGEAEARYLGVDTQRTKKLVVVLTAVAVAGSIAFAGLIGFVGLMAPHLVRIVLGPDHRTLLPASAIVGGTLLVGADVLARMLLAPTEIPVGIVTALAGAPLFLWLLVSQRRAW